MIARIVRAPAAFALAGALLSTCSGARTKAADAASCNANAAAPEMHTYLICSYVNFAVGEAPGLPFTARIEEVQRQIDSDGGLGTPLRAPNALGLIARDSEGRVLVRHWMTIPAAEGQQAGADPHVWTELICDPTKGTSTMLDSSGNLTIPQDQDKEHIDGFAAFHLMVSGRENLGAEIFEGLPAFRYRFPNNRHEHSVYEIVNSDELFLQLATIKPERYPDLVDDVHLTQIQREEPPETPFAWWTQSPTPVGRFAAEIPQRGGLLPLYTTIARTGTSSLFYDSTLDRLHGASSGAEHPSALRLDYKVEEDTVTITPTAFYGDFDRSRVFTSLKDLRQQTLPSHSGRLNDSVSFPELVQVGLKPLTLRIVTSHPDTPPPQTYSNAPSVEIGYAPVDRNGGVVVLHNLSSKAVTGFLARSFDKTGPRQGAGMGLGGSIAPGSWYRIHMGIGTTGGRCVNGTCVKDPPETAIVLQAALFNDGSYEGDAHLSAQFAAGEFGKQAQLARIKQEAEAIVAEEGVDDASKIERIRSAVQQLPDHPDKGVVAQFHAQFPTIPKDALTAAEIFLGPAMKSEMQAMDHMIQANETNFLKSRSKVTLARWWAGMTKDH
jgi:hypothetical protein